MFLVDIQCQQFDDLITQKTKILYIYFMKKFCSSLREIAKNIIDFEKKKMLPLLKEESKSHQDAEVSYICEK